MSGYDHRLTDYPRAKVKRWATRISVRLASHVLASILYVSIAALSCLGEQTEANSGKSQTQGASKTRPTFSPARYVRIFEDTGSKRILLYDPKRRRQDNQEQQREGQKEPEGLNSSQITVDGRSTILIQLAPDLMDENVPMNRLFMSATLGRRDGKPPKDLEVVGYNEVGKAQEGAESQKAVSLQTGANVQRTLLNMFFTTEDIIKTLYGECCAKELALNPRYNCRKEVADELVKSRFRLYLPEITAITDFFLDDDTARVAGMLGSEAFDIDIPSLQAIMQKYKADMSALFDQRVLTRFVLKYTLRAAHLELGGVDLDLAVEDDVLPLDRADMTQQVGVEREVRRGGNP